MPLPEKPLLAPWAEPFLSDTTAAFRHAARVVVVEGIEMDKLMSSLLCRLDGTRDVGSILRDYSPDSRRTVALALETLNTHGLLIEASGIEALRGTHRRNALAVSESVGGAISVEDAASALGQHVIRLYSDLERAEALKDILGQYGYKDVTLHPIEALTDHEFGNFLPRTFVVVAPSRARPAVLRHANDLALEHGQPWAQLQPFDGTRSTIGPAFTPTKTACFECFLIRKRAPLDFESLQHSIDRTSVEEDSSHRTEWHGTGQELASFGLFAHLLALELALGPNGVRPLASRIHTLEWNGPRVELHEHRLFRVPRCPSCGQRFTSLPQPWCEDQSPKNSGMPR